MISDKIMKNVIGFENWCEENKKKFIKKNNPDLYIKLYDKNNKRKTTGNE